MRLNGSIPVRMKIVNPNFVSGRLTDYESVMDFVETIIFEDKEDHRKDYVTVPEPADHPFPPASEP